jgi:lipoic acid synthetase
MALEAGIKHKGAQKVRPINIPVVPEVAAPLRKPEWIRVKWQAGQTADGSETQFSRVKKLLRKHRLNTVCEEASCPNIGECFSGGTATFMILGAICTRRCPFCDVGFGRPNPPDPQEPQALATAIADLALKYVVITSVDRDDLLDGGAEHFAQCIAAIRETSPATRIEVLVPDFRGRMDKALAILSRTPPDVFNHNLETVPRLYKQCRPGAEYAHSLQLLKAFKSRCPEVPTKSGLMVGLGESDTEINAVLEDMREHDINMLTIGQYLQPSASHHPVIRYVEPAQFKVWETMALSMGFDQATVGAMVRSSYHADNQAKSLIAAIDLL